MSYEKNFKKEYQEKLRSIDEILDMVEDNYYISAAQLAGSPDGLLSNVHKINGKVKDVLLQHSISCKKYPFFTEPNIKDSLLYETWFYGFYDRKFHESGLVSYFPSYLSQQACKRIHHRKPDMFWTISCPMDRFGNFCISMDNAFEMEMIEVAKIVVLEVNRNAPRTFGENLLPISKVNYIVENDSPLITLEPAEPGEVDIIIGEYVASLVEDGSTFQLGIGAIPNAVAQQFMDKKDLGIHTEMFSDSMMDLIKAGVVTNVNKKIWKYKSVGTFVYGSQKLYDFVDNNPAFLFLMGKNSNNPQIIAQNPKMVSINSALQIDLTGQVCSESIGNQQFSGVGGQVDTAHGAQLSEGGKSIIALKSTVKKGTISTIVPLLNQGAVVTLSRNDVDYVITEYGVASLRGRSIRERVKELINISHPNFRNDLRKEAARLGIW